MPNKLVVIVNSLNVQKIKKILLYEMKFLVPNYSSLQNSWLGSTAPTSPCSLSSTEFVEPPPEQNSWVRHCIYIYIYIYIYHNNLNGELCHLLLWLLHVPLAVQPVMTVVALCHVHPCYKVYTGSYPGPLYPFHILSPCEISGCRRGAFEVFAILGFLLNTG